MKVLGQELEPLKNQLLALVLNIYDWLLQFIPFIDCNTNNLPKTDKKCIIIKRPGSLKQLLYTDINYNNDNSIATIGYNIKELKPPFVSINNINNTNETELYNKHLPPYTVLIRTSYFSINYADVCIRWGLYESALKYIGWPIVPGFDFSGEVIWAGKDTHFKNGDKVFGFTMFGGYSNRILVPASQIRLIPKDVEPSVAAALPAVAGTALHAIHLANAWPNQLMTNSKAALIHSAAGGVGSMLIQMCKIRGFTPIVAVVGSSHKVNTCKELGADIVIDKSMYSDKQELNKKILESSVLNNNEAGYIAVFDANGAESLQHSYNQLSRCGRIITYGFHSNLPRNIHTLSPFQWIKMIINLIQIPKFDPMQLVLESKAILGFNLSFFADEKIIINKYMEQLEDWLTRKDIIIPKVTIFNMNEINKAHELIQSGKSIGKIVVKCN